MPTVATLLSHKGHDVLTIAPGATVFEAIGRMVEVGVGSILVVTDGAVKGIFTERDYLRRIALEGRTSRETRVEEVMTTDLVTVEPRASVEACLTTMTENKIRHLPVMEGDKLVGVISIGDCVRSVAKSAKGEAEEMRRFVRGGYTG